MASKRLHTFTVTRFVDNLPDLNVYSIFIMNSGGFLEDSMTPSDRLKDGQTLVSANGRFELGFFSPSHQTGIRYLGIWYKGIAPRTIVWVANTNRTLLTSNARLQLESNGVLVLSDRTHSPIFISTPAKNVSKPVLQILDSGNLIVRDDRLIYLGTTPLWQSFDYPSDTLLPRMTIGWNYRTGINVVLTSWKNTNDPLPGELTLGLDKPQLPQLLLERNSIKLSRWGPWDGVRFSGCDIFGPNQLIRPMFKTNYFIFDVFEEFLVRLQVTPFGKIQFLFWNSTISKWIPFITFNKDLCDNYAVCGPYGICDLDKRNCRCLKGFVSNKSRHWHGMAGAGGCKRIFERKCDVGEGFVKFKGLKLPDNGVVWPQLSPKQCENNCLQECNCNAYSHIDVYENGSNCVVWLDELLDMRAIPEGGDDIHIRMARAEFGMFLKELIVSDKMNKRKNLLVIIIVSSVCALVFSLLLLICCSRRQSTTRLDRQCSQHWNWSSNEEENLDFRLFEVDIISIATDNFSTANKIGEGGFGSVYKGVLHNGREIAVKRLSSSSRQGQEQFENESSLIARLQHRNLVKLVGCCVHEEERMLVYEYLANKSLDKFIFDQARKMLLTWATRINIILGVAKGLAYLHDDSGLRIVHRDLKASNILLDGDMTPKISDFGLAKILGDDNELKEMTMKVYGTFGYLSPEYATNGQFSTKSDVFSFGILALEIISGKRNWGFQHPGHDMNLLGHVWNLWRQGNSLEAMDPALGDASSEAEILRCIQVALLCAQRNPEERPTMSTVVYMLINDIMVLPEPTLPGFFPENYFLSNADGIGRPLSVSFNGLTVTTLNAR